MSEENKKPGAAEDPLREHSYDGIQEYDKRLPNWWLWTLYGAMIFSFGYWFYYHRSAPVPSATARLEQKMNALMMQASASGKDLDDGQLWKMSRDPNIVATGQQTYLTTCVSCHGLNMEGGIGTKLSDDQWIHGGRPTEIVQTLTKGVLAKGMPAWGPVLGKSKISEVAAYVLSKHEPPKDE